MRPETITYLAPSFYPRYKDATEWHMTLIKDSYNYYIYFFLFPLVVIRIIKYNKKNLIFQCEDSYSQGYMLLRRAFLLFFCFLPDTRPRAPLRAARKSCKCHFGLHLTCDTRFLNRPCHDLVVFKPFLQLRAICHPHHRIHNSKFIIRRVCITSWIVGFRLPIVTILLRNKVILSARNACTGGGES